MSNDKIRQRVQNSYAAFVTDVDPYRLCDYLKQEGIISIEQWQDMCGKNKTPLHRCRALLDFLLTGNNPRAFLVVRSVLEKENHHLLAEIDGDPSCLTEEERDPKPNESSKREQTTTEALEANAEKIKQDLNNEQARNKALQAEVEKLRQELDNEKKSNEKLKQKIVTERKSANEELEKTKTDSKDMILKLKLNLEREKQEREQLIVKAQEEKKILAEHRYKSNPVLVQRIGTRAVEEEKKEIRGLAILDKEFFVVSGESSEVEVYDLMKLGFRRRWNLKELIQPQDVGSCKRNKCLYIIDFKGDGQSKEILKVDPNGKLIKKWSTGDDSGFSLSVTDESNVILTVSDKNKLNEYSPDGQLIREINLSSEACICYPWRAIKLANGHFMVSHGGYDGELHRVCVVDANIKLKKSFGGKPGSNIGHMNEPCHLAIDGSGFVMVVDRGNSRVLLLDSDLQFKREILSKERHGLRFPCGILLDEINGRLFVVDGKLKFKNKLGLYKDAPISIFDF